MLKGYIIIQALSALVFMVGGWAILYKRKRKSPHDCSNCWYCSMIEKGKDGKLIYTCTYDKGKEKVMYDFALPVYCRRWCRRKKQW